MDIECAFVTGFDRWIAALDMALERRAMFNEIASIAVERLSEDQVHFVIRSAAGAHGIETLRTATTSPIEWRSRTPERMAELLLAAMRSHELV